jgi:bifunctional protein folC
MRTYQETIEYLFNSMPVFEKVGNSAYKPGLFNSESLDRHFNHPHRNYRTIHVAGTNGKGSCSHILAAVLQSAGYRVGLYTSPHLVDFKERIRVNGECILEDYVVDFVHQNVSFFEPLYPSFFELTTALAFKYFADCKVDVAVIEVGLGGRLDCTNIISPVLSVITNISLDHVALLGDSFSKIASEKAGVIKPQTPVVIGEYNEETLPVFRAKALEENAKLILAEDQLEVISYAQNKDNAWEYTTQHFGIVEGQLKGNYQVKNSNTILTAVKELQILGFNLSIDNVKEGFKHVETLTGLAGRWQTLSQTPHVLCDTGHNEAAWTYLSNQLNELVCNQLHIVFGMVDDKDIDAVIQLLPEKAVYYFTKASCKRALSEYSIEQKAKKRGLKGTSYSSVKEACCAALSAMLNNDCLFIGGSNYIVSEVLISQPWLKK